jgi:hypothetical protein
MGCSAGHRWATAGGDKRPSAITQGEPARVCLTVHAGALITSKLVMRIRFVLLLYDRPLSLRDLGL